MKCMKTLLYWSHIHRNTHMGSIWETRVPPWGPDPDVLKLQNVWIFFFLRMHTCLYRIRITTIPQPLDVLQQSAQLGKKNASPLSLSWSLNSHIWQHPCWCLSITVWVQWEGVKSRSWRDSRNRCLNVQLKYFRANSLLLELDPFVIKSHPVNTWCFYNTIVTLDYKPGETGISNQVVMPHLLVF